MNKYFQNSSQMVGMVGSLPYHWCCHELMKRNLNWEFPDSQGSLASMPHKLVVIFCKGHCENAWNIPQPWNWLGHLGSVTTLVIYTSLPTFYLQCNSITSPERGAKLGSDFKLAWRILLLPFPLFFQSCAEAEEKKGERGKKMGDSILEVPQDYYPAWVTAW